MHRRRQYRAITKWLFPVLTIAIFSIIGAVYGGVSSTSAAPGLKPHLNLGITADQNNVAPAIKIYMSSGKAHAMPKPSRHPSSSRIGMS